MVVSQNSTHSQRDTHPLDLAQWFVQGQRLLSGAHFKLLHAHDDIMLFRMLLAIGINFIIVCHSICFGYRVAVNMTWAIFNG